MARGYYDQKIALKLAEICALTYIQFQQGQTNRDYDGTIQPPPGYRQIAVFKAPEISFGRKKLVADSSNKLNISEITPDKIMLTDLKTLEASARFIRKTFFGFALVAIDGSGNGIIALRGTENPYEWVMNANFVQTSVPMAWFKDKRLETAKVHVGFLTLYAFLREQIIQAARQLKNSNVIYITGHSLGAALAILAVLDIGLNLFPIEPEEKSYLQMYNYAGPRVGNPDFVVVYNEKVPNSYRIVNLADIVPTLPPENILNYQYQHIGTPKQEWSYLHQTGDIGDNHSLQKNYIPALERPFKVNNLQFGIPGKW